jgi:predicted nucleotidyltransferase
MPVIPQPLLEGIVRTYAPRRIVLFGSAARDEAGPDSDLDLLVVLNDDVPAEALKWPRMHEARGSYTGPVDIVPCRESVLRERARVTGSFADTVLRDGIVVYERQH